MATTSTPIPDIASDSAAPARPLRRAIIAIVLLVAAIFGARWGYHHWQFAAIHEHTDDAQVDGRVVPVLAKVGGYVREVKVAENDSVHAGQLLVKVDDAEYQQRLAQATADMRAAEAAAGTSDGSGQASAQVASARSQRAALDAQIGSAKVRVEAAKADLARAEELAGRQIISRAQLDAAHAAMDAAQAAEVSLERQAASADAMIANAQAGVRVASARLDAARSARDAAALSLSYTTITAPNAGIVARKQVEVGQLVQPGQPLLAIVADTGVWVTANFKETQLSNMRVGQTVAIDVDAYHGCHAEGAIQSISAATGAKFSLLPPDNATGNFTKVVQRVPVRIRITSGCGPDRPLRPGMSVTATVQTK